MIEVWDPSGRFVTRQQGRTTSHSFSFGPHYDPANVGFGLLVAHNDEVLPPGTGYAEHSHAELEIVTVVLSGALRHSSSVGAGVVGPGGVQRLSAGTGVVHSERADVPGVTEPTRFVQTWLRPSRPGLTPDYASAAGVDAQGVHPLVGSGGVLGVAADAALYAGNLASGSAAALPDAPRLHLFVVEGRLLLGDVLLGPADAARISDEGGLTVTSADASRFLLWVSG